MDDSWVCVVCGARITRSSAQRELWLDDEGMATAAEPVLHPHNPYHGTAPQQAPPEGQSR